MFRKKLLQIDACLNVGSTGRIAEDLAKLAQEHGWECYHIHGSRYVNPPSRMITYQPGSVADEYIHYAEHRLFDNDGLASRVVTRRIVKRIKEVSPDVIQLHDLHDHWLNYKILFEYLNTLNIPIVWTQHDCWSFTGGCSYFTLLGCEQWKNGCSKSCPERSCHFMRRLWNKTELHYNLKRELFSATNNLTLVPVSHWLEGLLKESFLKKKNIRMIHNGIDINVFRPLDDISILRKHGLEGINHVGAKFVLIGVAHPWSERKGLKDYIALSKVLPPNCIIVLIGLSEEQRNGLPENIVGLGVTRNVDELVELYNVADIVLNLSHEETFGLTTAEGFACGTPGIVYNATASPELITPETGIIVETGDIQGVADAVKQILANGKSSYTIACRKRAEEFFNKNKCFEKYLKLYEDLIDRNK